jgi:hypothetical protein
LGYADDVTAIAPTPKEGSVILNEMNGDLALLGLETAFNKSAHLAEPGTPDVTLNGKTIPQQQQIKIVGYTFDVNGLDIATTTATYLEEAQAAKKRAVALGMNSGARGLHPQNATQVYKAFVQSRLNHVAYPSALFNRHPAYRAQIRTTTERVNKFTLGIQALLKQSAISTWDDIQDMYIDKLEKFFSKLHEQHPLRQIPQPNPRTALIHLHELVAAP